MITWFLKQTLKSKYQGPHLALGSSKVVKCEDLRSILHSLFPKTLLVVLHITILKYNIPFFIIYYNIPRLNNATLRILLESYYSTEILDTD